MIATQYEIERHLDEGVVVLTPTGPLDEMDIDAQFAYAHKFVADNPYSKGAVFNLTFVGRITSKPIGLIADLASRMEETGGKLVLAHAEKVLDALHICGIDEIIAISATLADAKKLIMSGPTQAASPAKPSAADVSFFSTRPSASSVKLDISSAEAPVEILPVPAPKPAAVPAADVDLSAFSTAPSQKAAKPYDQDVSFALGLVASPSVEVAAADAPAAAPKAKPAAPAAEADLSAFGMGGAPVPAPKAKPAAAPDADALISSGFSADPAAQMGAILKDAAAKLRGNLSGFDVRRKDLEDAMAAKQSRIESLNSEAKTLRAELKSLEKEEARVAAAIQSFQVPGA